MKKLILLMLCCMMLTACAGPEGPTVPQTRPLSTEATTAPAEATEPPTEAPTAAPTDAPTEPEPTTVTFNVYSGNDDADGFIQTQVETESIHHSLVIEKLIEAGVLTEDTALNSFEEADQVLYLDFNSAFQELLFAQGTAGEKMLMGSVVNTFLSAYDAASVVITVNGKVLESGHVIYDYPLEYVE